MRPFYHPVRHLLARLFVQHSDAEVSSVASTVFAQDSRKNVLSALLGVTRSRMRMERGIASSVSTLQDMGTGGGTGGFEGRADEGDDDLDEEDEGEEDSKRRKGRRIVEVNPEDVRSVPMDYFFAGVPPDSKAPCLSDESKEKMWRAYRDNPGSEMIDKLAEEYRVRKQRVHAILWLKDIEKKEMAERGTPLADDIEKGFEEIHGSYDKADNERHYILPSTKPDFSVQSEGWEGSVKASDQTVDEASAKEEQMLVEEFVQRMNFNKMQIAGMFNADKANRRRPPEGWSYLVEELGDEGKRGRRGGRRFIARPDGTHRGLDDTEKIFLKRETVRPRRRLTPR